MKKLILLGGLTPQQFLRDYWHKKPLLIRQAIPYFKPVLSRDQLLSLARNDDVESRLISHFGKRWQIKHGPLADRHGGHCPPGLRTACRTPGHHEEGLDDAGARHQSA